jgi:AmmeMemoRadiSam system protein A
VRTIPLAASLALAAFAAATARGVGHAGTIPAQETPAAPAGPAPSPTPPADLMEPLDAAERASLLRLAWRTLVGHLTNHPIQDSELEQYDLTPRLLSPRGCFVTLLKGAEVRGNQGEIDPTRPLYQQVILFTRRAATRDPRFLPVTEHDLGAILVRVEVIGRRIQVDGPAGIANGALGVFLEKWGRRALFLPGTAAAARWTPERTLDELCRQAALPSGAWRQGARLEVFTTEVVEGPQPQPAPSPSPSPAASPAPVS